MNSDNPAHVLQAQTNGEHVYDALVSSSQSEPTRNDQSNIYLICVKFNISGLDANSIERDLHSY